MLKRDYDPTQFRNVAKVVFKTNKRVRCYADSWEAVAKEMIKAAETIEPSKETTAIGTGGYVLVPHLHKREMWINAYVATECVADALGIELEDR